MTNVNKYITIKTERRKDIRNRFNNPLKGVERNEKLLMTHRNKKGVEKRLLLTCVFLYLQKTNKELIKLKNAILLILAMSLILTTLAACQNTAADKSRVETTTAEPTTVVETITEVETTTVVTTKTKPKPTDKPKENPPTETQYIPAYRGKLTKEQILKIKEDYIEWAEKNSIPVSKDILAIGAYFGTYNGWMAIYIDSCIAHFPVLGGPTIEGYYFETGHLCINGPMYIYKNSEFFKLSEAYEMGIVTKEDIRDIHWHYNDKETNRKEMDYYVKNSHS